ncbi:MAG: PEP-CTERM sorting domain-containing protein [Phycisphaeraceae bacterium]|nr:PEP-CTERM sorting domain-containing protein [Phycisphaeraceae bacterium]
MKTGRLFAGLAMAGILSGGTTFGQILVEDFNSGEFVPGSSRVISDNAYSWDGPGDSLGGWTVVEGWYSEGPAPAGYPIRLDGSATMSMNSVIIGANNVDGGSWTSTDGNIGGYHQRYNDVPKGAWTYTTELTPEMGGARDADGNALAFTVIYDAELIGYNSGIIELDSGGTPTGATQPGRGWVGSISASLVLDGQSHNADSPIFVWKDNQHHSNQNLPPEYFDVSEFQPAATTLGAADAWGWAWEYSWFDTDDSAPSAVRGVTPGVIEQTVGNGETIEFRARVGRTDFPGRAGGEWHYMALGMDNLKIVALEAGDVNGDLQVDIDDASVLLTNFGTTSGATWTDGDFNGDGAVDIDDASLLLGNFGTSYSSPAAGEIEVTIDVANKQVIIEANEVALLRLEDPSGNIISYDPAVPFSTVNPVTPTLVGEFMLGDFITGTAVIGFENFENQEVIIGHQLLGQDRIDNTFILIPEPASLALLGLGGLALLRRRAA